MTGPALLQSITGDDHFRVEQIASAASRYFEIPLVQILGRVQDRKLSLVRCL